jgi:hypothetical protein
MMHKRHTKHACLDAVETRLSAATRWWQGTPRVGLTTLPHIPNELAAQARRCPGLLSRIAVIERKGARGRVEAGLRRKLRERPRAPTAISKELSETVQQNALVVLDIPGNHGQDVIPNWGRKIGTSLSEWRAD